MFQLKHRLERLRGTQTHDSIGTMTGVNSLASSDVLLEGLGLDADDEFFVDDHGHVQLADEVEDRTCNAKPETGNRKHRVRFGHARTHNKQLCVSSCGVILGRATFYGSEAPNGVWVSLYQIWFILLLSSCRPSG